MSKIIRIGGAIYIDCPESEWACLYCGRTVLFPDAAASAGDRPTCNCGRGLRTMVRNPSPALRALHAELANALEGTGVIVESVWSRHFDDGHEVLFARLRFRVPRRQYDPKHQYILPLLPRVPDDTWGGEYYAGDSVYAITEFN